MKDKFMFYLIWLVLLTLVGSLSSFGQSNDGNQKTVSGRVSDASGQPLPGVIVIETEEKTYEPYLLLERIFLEHMYLLPIATDEVRKTSLTQNPGY